MSESTPDWVANKQRGPKAKYPFATVEARQGFVVPVDEQTCKYSSFRVMAATKGTELGRKFHTRVNPENGAFEVWREY